MTETVAPETAAENTAPARDSLPPMAGQILNLVEGRFTRITEIAREQEKVGDVGKLLSEAIETSTDPEVVKARQVIEKANEAILKAQKAAEAKVKPTLNVPSDEDLAKLDEEYKNLSSEINTYNGVFSMETRNVKENGLTVFDYFGQLPGRKRGAKSGQGTGTSRPRVSTLEYTQDVKGEQGWKKAEKDGKSTFSVLIAALKADADNEVDLTASDLHAAWTDQNGKKDWSDLPDVTTFVYQADDKHRWHIRVTK